MLNKLRQPIMKFIDIGANLTDPVFNGVYRGNHKHDDDFEAMLQRADRAGVERIIVTGGSLHESTRAIELAKKHAGRLFATVGCHPTRCREFETAATTPAAYMDGLIGLTDAHAGHPPAAGVSGPAGHCAADCPLVVAYGEFGLDFDRLQFCDRHTQLRYFELQLQSCGQRHKLPLFLHCRNASEPFYELLRTYRDRFPSGVVHSFDGSREDVQRAVDLDLYIGINGCSLKTEENLQVLKDIPSERLMIETDAPWCEVKPSHASQRHLSGELSKSLATEVKRPEQWKPGLMVRGRNEPCSIVKVMEIVASVQQRPLAELADIIYSNTRKLFFANH